jgi:hypothetical protein
MTDYECGVAQASAVYKEVIRGYVEENERLREYAYALEECKKSTHYCDGCPHNPEFEGGDPRCEFDFDALHAAAGMEPDE